MPGAEVTRGALGGVVSIKDFADRVTDPEVGPVHMTGDHENAADRQMVMGNVREPERLGLGLEAAQEGEDRGTGSLSGAEHLVDGVGVLGIHTPVTGEERSQTGGVGQNVEEVVPADVLTAGFRNRHVNQVTCPGD